MVRIEIDVPEQQVQMALSYALVLLRDEIRRVEPHAHLESSSRYMQGLQSAVVTLDLLCDKAHSQPTLVGYSLTPNGEDALDRELTRRDQIARGGA